MASFPISLAFQGKTVTVKNVSTATTASELYDAALAALELSEETQLKLLFKGKRLEKGSTKIVFQNIPSKTPKIMVMATSAVVAKEIASKRSDPTIRGFDQELAPKRQQNGEQHWGDGIVQSKDYKFCRFQACTDQSFGHRPTEKTPHEFAAMQLLQKLATDPGVVAIMKERQLVVGALGEMDPIDDRLMQKKQQHGGCLLGYNTNAGARIDIKLRTDDLEGFRPYPELASTLIHELSHNWVGEHNLLFWTNYAQMRAEYLHTHARLRTTMVKGKTTAELAGLNKAKLENVFEFIMNELIKEMAQHGLHPLMIEAPIRQRCEELERKESGNKLGGGSGSTTTGTARDLALAAAERRAREQKGKE